MRRAISELPDGEYRYEAHLESGRGRLELLTVRARVVVAGDAVTVDLTGTSPQTAGPTNVGPAMAPTGAFTILKSFLDAGSDVNSGAFRPLTVNANPPVPCGGMVEVKYCVETAAMGALARALGGHVTGDLKGSGNHCYVGGPDPETGETFIFYEYPAGGTGAYAGGDGNNTVRAWTESDMTALQPIEAVEQRYPVRIERTALREDSGGPGRWRGGLGLTREVRIRASGTRLSVLAERAVLPPFGVCGGGAGATNHFWVRRGGRPISAPSTRASSARPGRARPERIASPVRRARPGRAGTGICGATRRAPVLRPDSPFSEWAPSHHLGRSRRHRRSAAVVSRRSSIPAWRWAAATSASTSSSLVSNAHAIRMMFSLGAPRREKL